MATKAVELEFEATYQTQLCPRLSKQQCAHWAWWSIAEGETNQSHFCWTNATLEEKLQYISCCLWLYFHFACCCVWSYGCPVTSAYSADPMRPNSSAPQLPKIMDLRGLHLPAIHSSQVKAYFYTTNNLSWPECCTVNTNIKHCC